MEWSRRPQIHSLKDDMREIPLRRMGRSIRRGGDERQGNTARRREKRRGDAGHVAVGGAGGESHVDNTRLSKP